MFKSLNVLALALVFGVAAHAADTADPTELKKIRDVYMGQLQKLQEKFVKDMGAAPQQHVDALATLEKMFQKDGDLKSLLIVRAERTRFAASSDPVAIKVVEKPKQLAQLQEDFIQSCRDFAKSRDSAIIDLTQKYIRSLTTLQRDLTQQGRIDDAMKVMNEIEAVKQIDPVKSARERVTSDGTNAPASGDAPAKGTGVDTSSIEQMIHGKVASWNSMSGEITCSYDFAAKDQFMDFEGSTIDDLRERLVCENKPVRFLPSFKSVSKVEFQGWHYSGPGGIRIALGNGLTAEIGFGDAHSKLLLYQDNAHFPIVSFDREIDSYKKYDVALSIQGDKIVWDIDGRNVATVALQRALQYPLQLTFGREGNRTMFDNVTITGTLSIGHVKALAE